MLEQDNLNRTIEIWIHELKKYDIDQLRAKPSLQSWSLGQVYMHLIENMRFYVEQIRICISTNEHAHDQASSAGKRMFLNNCFPDEVIEGPPENAVTPQPESKEQLLRLLIQAKDQVNSVAAAIETSAFNGKTKHPGLNYFSARDWLQFADMHFRHHIRQKERIDNFLKGEYNHSS